MPLTSNDIESELSYAYLHAIAAHAGMSCKVTDRHDDGAGADAEVTYRGVTTHQYIRHVQLNIQLKATVNPGTLLPDHFSYFMSGIRRYDKLRTDDSLIYKILVILFLPRDVSEWLQCSAAELVLKNAAYWVNLYDAAASTNATGETIYIPKVNLLTPEELKRLIEMAVHKTIPLYTKP